MQAIPVLLVCIFFFSLAGCESFKKEFSGGPELPHDELYQMFLMKAKVIDDVVVLKEQSKNDPQVRRLYDDFKEHYNATIDSLKVSITAREDPQKYADRLRKQINVVRKSEEAVIKHASLANPPDPQRGAIVADIVAGIMEVWKSWQQELRDRRDELRAALDAEKAPNFEAIK